MRNGRERERKVVIGVDLRAFARLLRLLRGTSDLTPDREILNPFLVKKFDAETGLALCDIDVGVSWTKACVTDEHFAVDTDDCEQLLYVDRAETER